MYDIIGDIHGHANELKSLLTKMGYSIIHGVWQHKQRKAIFLGDYIDKGPSIRETLKIVKGMTEAGHALAIMGNREFNALAWNHQKEDGSYLRAHNPRHYEQHKETLKQFEHHQEEWPNYLQWFYTLPLFLELEGCRAVHACWDDAHIHWLKRYNGPLLTESLLVTAHQKKLIAKKVIDEILKGKEVDIPEEYAWPDKYGIYRKENRIKWWVEPRPDTTYGDYVFNCPEELKGQLVDVSPAVFIYPRTAPPVFVGHYWLEGTEPEIMGSNVACLDYSVAHNGLLVAYRWDGETVLRKEKLVF